MLGRSGPVLEATGSAAARYGRTGHGRGHDTRSTSTHRGRQSRLRLAIMVSRARPLLRGCRLPSSPRTAGRRLRRKLKGRACGSRWRCCHGERRVIVGRPCVGRNGVLGFVDRNFSIIPRGPQREHEYDRGENGCQAKSADKRERKPVAGVVPLPDNELSPLSWSEFLNCELFKLDFAPAQAALGGCWAWSRARRRKGRLYRYGTRGRGLRLGLGPARAGAFWRGHGRR